MDESLVALYSREAANWYEGWYKGRDVGRASGRKEAFDATLRVLNECFDDGIISTNDHVAIVGRLSKLA